jgi:hypothetical protein
MAMDVLGSGFWSPIVTLPGRDDAQHADLERTPSLNQTPRSEADLPRPRFVRAYARAPLNQSALGVAGPGEFDLVLELDRYVEFDDFAVEAIEPTAELLATMPEPSDGDRPRSFIECSLELQDSDTILALRRFHVVPGGLRDPKLDRDGDVLRRPMRVDELYAARPDRTYVSVWATCGPRRRLTSELVTLEDARALVDRWCRWRIQPVGNLHPAGRALICGEPFGGSEG